MKTKIILGFIVSILILFSLILAASSYLKLKDSEWVCIAQECDEFATGDDWVKQNCKLEGNEMICEFQYEGETFRVPLDGVDISKMVSCAEYKCSSKVLISYVNKFQEVK